MAFANNMSTYTTNIKQLSKVKISKIIQSGESFGFWLGGLGKKTLTSNDIPLARDNLSGLASNLISNSINKFERKIIGKVAERAGKGFTLFNSNDDVNELVKS